MNLELKAIPIIETLRNAGFQAVFAGGCVRDRLLGLKPKDIDITTDATPEQVEELFEKTITVGKQFGVIKVIGKKGLDLDVATFRKEGNYTDDRHPESVTFCSMKEDAYRRDFTINGMFYDPTEDKLIDFVGGQADLLEGVIRFIGNPHKRIAEDKLRMLRALRFATRLNFTIEKDSYAAIVLFAKEILKVSSERIFDELTKMFTSDAPDKALDLLQDTGLLKYILPEVQKLVGVEQGEKYHPEGNTFFHTKLVMKYSLPTEEARWGALLHDIGKPTTFRIRKGRPTFYGHEDVGADLADNVMRRMKVKNAFRTAVVYLVKDHMKFFSVQNMKLATVKRFMREPLFMNLLALHKADILGSNGDLQNYNYAYTKYAELAQDLNPPALLTGYDLLNMNLTSGPLFKKILKKVETQQLENKLKTKEDAINFAQQLIKNKEYQK